MTDGHSVSAIIGYMRNKKGFFRNYNNLLNQILPLYENVDNILKADFLLTWNDLVSPNREIVQLAKEFKKPSFIIEHGMKAVSDYQKDLQDVRFNMGGKPFTADHMFLWGDKSKEIMIESGVSSDKISVVGSPIIYNYEYVYSCGSETKTVPFNAGLSIIDPETERKWELQEGIISLPQIDRDERGNPAGNLITFFPYHDWTEQGLENTKEIWDKIKHLPNIVVAASSSYQNHKPENPFLDLLKVEPYEERIKKIICSDIRRPGNIDFVKNILRRSKLIITTIPGTINGIAWCMDVPILSPKIDWNWRYKGKPIFDICDADYSCELDDIEINIHNILKDDTKENERLKYAKYYMGIDKGNPIENIRSFIDDYS